MPSYLLHKVIQVVALIANKLRVDFQRFFLTQKSRKFSIVTKSS